MGFDDDDGTTLSRNEHKQMRSSGLGGDSRKKKKHKLDGSGKKDDRTHGAGGHIPTDPGGGRENGKEGAGEANRAASSEKPVVLPATGWKSTKVAKGDVPSKKRSKAGSGDPTRDSAGGGQGPEAVRKEGGAHDQPGTVTLNILARGSERERLHQQRQALPISKAQKEILWTLKRHDTLVLVGETGSGKTTQVTSPSFERGVSIMQAGAHLWP